MEINARNSNEVVSTDRKHETIGNFIRKNNNNL